MSDGYAKIFASIYDGTLAEHWQALVTFQQLMILSNARGVVDMTPFSISRRTGIPLEIIEAGIAVLAAPDPRSRSKEADGRRIVLLDPDRDWGWRLVNHAYYRGLMSATDKKEADRIRIATKRDKVRHDATDRDMSQPSQEVADVAQAEAEAEATTTTTEARPTHHATNARDAARGVEDGPSPSSPAPDPKPHGMAVATAIALRKRGLRCTAQHPDLTAAEAEGVTVDAVIAMADAYPDKPFGYVISAARRQHAESPRTVTAAQPRAGPQTAPISKTAAAFAALDRIANGNASHADAIDTTAALVHIADRPRLAAPAGAEP